MAEARSRGVAVHNSWGSGHHALQILLVTALAGCGWMPGADRSAAVPSSTPESRTLEFPTQALPVVSSPTPSPLPPSTPTPACNVSQGTVVEDQYRGHNVQQDVPVLVYLPPCYATMPGPLPVLYLLHGKPFTEKHWVDLGVVGAEQARPATTNAAHWILVMPRVPEPLFSSSDGGPGSYEDEFTRWLMPYIEFDISRAEGSWRQGHRRDFTRRRVVLGNRLAASRAVWDRDRAQPGPGSESPPPGI